MTDAVFPTQETASSHAFSGVIKWASHVDAVVPGTEDYMATDQGLAGAPLNEFAETHSATSFDVTIDTGAAFEGGRWMGRDVTTTVTLASSTSNQTVYAGWSKSSANTVHVGLDSDFPAGYAGRRIPLWTYDTDGSGVPSAPTDERDVGLPTFARTDTDITWSQNSRIRSGATGSLSDFYFRHTDVSGDYSNTGFLPYNNGMILSPDTSVIIAESDNATVQGHIHANVGVADMYGGYEIEGNKVAQSIAASGQVGLTSGTAVVDTGITATNATFTLALGVDDPNADTKVSGRLFWDDAAGTYKVEFVEQETSVNPTVNYDVIRVR